MEAEREKWAQAMGRRQGWFGDVHANQALQQGWSAKPSEQGRLEMETQHVRNKLDELQGRNNNYAGRTVGHGGSPRLGPVLEIPRQFLHRVLSANLVSVPAALRPLFFVELRADLSAFDVRVLAAAPARQRDEGAEERGGGPMKSPPTDEEVERSIEVCLAEPVVSAHWTEITIDAALPPIPKSVRERRARPPARKALRGWDTRKARACITYATMLDAEPAFLFFSNEKGTPTVLSVCGDRCEKVELPKAASSSSAASSA